MGYYSRAEDDDCKDARVSNLSTEKRKEKRFACEDSRLQVLLVNRGPASPSWHTVKTLNNDIKICVTTTFL
jgi:hypothetical protein